MINSPCMKALLATCQVTKASKKIIKSEASRRVPQTKSPAKDQARVSKSAKSDLGQERFPGVPLDIFEHNLVGSSLLNLVSPDEAVTGHPAPIGISNLDIASAHLAATNGASGAPNFDPNSSVFQSFCVLTGSAAYPLLYSSGTTFAWGQNVAEIGFADSAHCVVSTSGTERELWGLLRSDYTDNFLLSEYIPSIKRHAYPINITGVGSIQVTVVMDADSGYSGKLIYTDTVNTTTTDFVGGVTETIGAGGLGTHYLAIVFDNALDSVNVGVAVQLNGDTAYSPISPQVLTYLQYSNMPYLADRAGALRINSAELVITNCQPALFAGGTIQSGKVVNPAAPDATWTNYLYQLNKTYLANMKYGLHNLWIAQGSRWNMGTPQDIGINRARTARYCNPFMNYDTVFVTMINYSSQIAAGAIQSLPLEFKVNAWCDYTTSDTSIGTVPGIVFTDKWLTAVSILAAAYVITDNPSHVGLKNKMKKFVSFLTSDDPRAAALRAGGQTAVKMLSQFAPLVMSMLL